MCFFISRFQPVNVTVLFSQQLSLSVSLSTADSSAWLISARFALALSVSFLSHLIVHQFSLNLPFLPLSLWVFFTYILPSLKGHSADLYTDKCQQDQIWEIYDRWQHKVLISAQLDCITFWFSTCFPFSSRWSEAIEIEGCCQGYLHWYFTMPWNDIPVKSLE